MSKYTTSEPKLHYKMFKAGKFWVFMSLSGAMLIGGLTTATPASAATTGTADATETPSSDSNTGENQATLRTVATAEPAATLTSNETSETQGQSEAPAGQSTATVDSPTETPNIDAADDTKPEAKTPAITEATQPSDVNSDDTITESADDRDTVSSSNQLGQPKSDAELTTDSTADIATNPTEATADTKTLKKVQVDAVSQPADDSITGLSLNLLVGQSNDVEPAEVNIEGNQYYRLGIDGQFTVSADDLVAGKSYDVATISLTTSADDKSLVVALDKAGADVGASVFDNTPNGNEIGSVVLSGHKLVFTVSDSYDPAKHALIGNGLLAFNGPWIMMLNSNTDPKIITQMPFTNTLTITSPQGETVNSYDFNFQKVTPVPLTKWFKDFLAVTPSADNVVAANMLYQQVIPNTDVLAELQASNGKTGDTIQRDAYQYAYRISADKLYKITGGEFQTWGYVANSETNQLVRIDTGNNDDSYAKPFFISYANNQVHEAPTNTSLQDLEAQNFDGMAYSLQDDGSYLVYYNLSAAELAKTTTTLSTRNSVEAQYDTSIAAANTATQDYYGGAMNDIPPVFQIATSFDFENEFVPNTTTIASLDLKTGAVLDTSIKTSVPNGIDLSTNALAVYHYLDAETGEFLSPAEKGVIYKPTGSNTETAPAKTIDGYQLLDKIPAGYTLPDKVTGTVIPGDSLTVDLPQVQGVVTDYYLLYLSDRTTSPLTKSVTQTINYLDAKDQTIVVATPNTQTVDFTTTELRDAKTGDLIGYDVNGDNVLDTKVLADAWRPETAEFQTVASPTPAEVGYDTVDQPVVTGTTVNSASADSVINVLYDHNAPTTTPTGPTDPGTTTTPTNPTGPGTTTTPTDPTGPTTPTDQTGTDTPGNPTGPTTPTDPTGPETPDNPTGPTTPTNPTGSETPSTPTNPTSPTTPVAPTTPTTTPGTTQPGTGVAQLTPTTSTETGSSIQSNQTVTDTQSANPQATRQLTSTQSGTELQATSAVSQPTAQAQTDTLPQTREARYAQASLAGWLLLSVAGFLGISVKKRREH